MAYASSGMRIFEGFNQHENAGDYLDLDVEEFLNFSKRHYLLHDKRSWSMDCTARHNLLYDMIAGKLPFNRFRVLIGASSINEGLVSSSLPMDASSVNEGLVSLAKPKTESICYDQETQIIDSSRTKLEETVIDLTGELSSVKDDLRKLRAVLEDLENSIYEARENAAIALDEEVGKFKKATKTLKDQYQEEIISLQAEIDKYRKAEITKSIRDEKRAAISQGPPQHFETPLSPRTSVELETWTKAKKRSVEIASALYQTNELLNEAQIENHEQDQETIEKQILAIEEKDRIIEAMTEAMRKMESELAQMKDQAALTILQYEETIANLSNDFIAKENVLKLAIDEKDGIIARIADTMPKMELEYKEQAAQTNEVFEKTIENFSNDFSKKENALMLAIEEKDAIIAELTEEIRKIELELTQAKEQAVQAHSQYEKTIEKLSNEYNTTMEGEKELREQELSKLTKEMQAKDEQMEKLMKINMANQENIQKMGMREAEELIARSRSEMDSTVSNAEDESRLKQEIDSLKKIIDSLREEISKHPDILKNAEAKHAKEIQQLTGRYEDKLKSLEALEENNKEDYRERKSKEEKESESSVSDAKDNGKQVKEREIEKNKGEQVKERDIEKNKGEQVKERKIEKYREDADELASKMEENVDQIIDGGIIVEDLQEIAQESIDVASRNDGLVVADHDRAPRERPEPSGSPNLVKSHKKEMNEYKKLLSESIKKCEKLQKTVKDYQDIKETLEAYIADLERKLQEFKREDKPMEINEDIIDSLINKLHANSQDIGLNEMARLHAELIEAIRKFLLDNPDNNVSLKPAIETTEKPLTKAERRRVLLSMEGTVRQLVAEEASMKNKVKDLHQKIQKGQERYHSLQRPRDSPGKNKRVSSTAQRTNAPNQNTRLPRFVRNDGEGKPPFVVHVVQKKNK